MLANKHAYAISSGDLNPYTLRTEFYIIPAAAGARVLAMAVKTAPSRALFTYARSDRVNCVVGRK
jgi:hypothetical protein